MAEHAPLVSFSKGFPIREDEKYGLNIPIDPCATQCLILLLEAKVS